MDDKTRNEIEAAVFRRLVHHFRERADVQNIDVMTLAGSCRHCLAKWYKAAANERGVGLDYDQTREIVYGMPYGEWKARHQTESTAETKQAYKDNIDRYGEAGEHWFDKEV